MMKRAAKAVPPIIMTIQFVNRHPKYLRIVSSASADAFNSTYCVANPPIMGPKKIDVKINLLLMKVGVHGFSAMSSREKMG